MRHLVDLSLTINHSMRGVEILPKRQLVQDGWNTTTLGLYSHCGTHMDAPRHFLADGAGLDQQDLSVCVGPARVINLAPIAPGQSIDIECLGGAAAEIDEGDRVLLRTDWYHRHGTPSYRDELPRISLELAHFLADRRVALLGVEPPSVADVNNRQELIDVHEVLLRGGVLIVEGLANLDQLQSNVVDFIALPLKIENGDGSPVRAIAIEDVPDERTDPAQP